jgi:protoporphyrinogen oxidase
MYRVVAFDQKTTEQLKQVNYLNDRLGFHQHTKGAPKYYPLKGGIGAWTEYLSQQVVEAGVEIIVGHSVDKISPISAGFDISYAEKTLHVDELIWTVSSALLPRYLPFNTQLQRPNFRKTALFDFIFEQPLNTRCKYINNFEATHISTRLTCYQNLVPVSSFFATTVEVLVDYIDDENQLLEQVATELVAMGLVNKNNPCKFKQYRPVGEGFPVITVENDRLLKQLNQEVLEKYSNITLLGRSSSKGFFMSELLVDAYNSCC